jgi:hypothetical protein
MEKEDDSGRFSVNPQFLSMDKNFKGVGGRLAYTKDLDKSSSLQAYADMMAGKPAGQDAFVKPQKIGVEYRKSFAKGGKVKSSSASSRADGIAQRGKTKGRFV